MEIRSLKSCLKHYRSKNASIRVSVASSPFASAEILVELAKDNNIQVLEAVADNPNTPSNILIDLSESPIGDISYKAIYNPNYNSKYKNDVIAAAKSNNPEILVKLATHEYWLVRELVAINDFTPSKALITLARDNNFSVKIALASNWELIPDKAAFILLSDDDSDVRDEAYDVLEFCCWSPSFNFDDLDTLLLLFKALVMNKSFYEDYYDDISEELLEKINSLLLRF